jgi:hypothetical protein
MVRDASHQSMCHARPLLLSFAAAVVAICVIAQPVSAATAYNIPSGSWPVPIAASRTDRIGANCTFDLHTYGTAVSTLQWDSSHDLEISYRCMILSSVAMAAPNVSGEPFANLRLMNSAGTLGTGLAWPLSRSGIVAGCSCGTHIATEAGPTWELKGVDCCGVGSNHNWWYEADGNVKVDRDTCVTTDNPVPAKPQCSGYHAVPTPDDIRAANSSFALATCGGSSGCPLSMSNVTTYANVSSGHGLSGSLAPPTAPDGTTEAAHSNDCKLASMTAKDTIGPFDTLYSPVGAVHNPTVTSQNFRSATRTASTSPSQRPPTPRRATCTSTFTTCKTT